MALTVFRNDSTGHEGTPELEPGVIYDGPEKHAGVSAAVEELALLTTPGSVWARCGLELRAGDGSALAPVSIVQSERHHIRKAITAVHSEEYVERLRAASAAVRRRREQGDPAYLDLSTGDGAAVSPGTFAAAWGSVGACLDAVDHVMLRPGDTAFALVWPPGHHAESSRSVRGADRAMGFCYFSNAAIAALYARDHAVKFHSDRPNRIVILDIDNHRANGTRTAIAHEQFISLIDLCYLAPFDPRSGQYTDFKWDSGRRTMEVGREYPHLHSDPSIGARPHPVVEAPNILTVEVKGRAVPEAEARLRGRAVGGALDPETALDLLIRRALDPLRTAPPDLIILSLGLDAAENDPLGGAGLNPGGFYTFVRGLRCTFPNAAVMGALEGGYEPDNWYRCLQPALLALHEDPSDAINRCRIFAENRERFSPGRRS